MPTCVYGICPHVYVVYGHMCMWCIHTWELVHWGLRKTSGILLYHSLLSFLETRSLTEPEASLVDTKPLWLSCPYSQHWGCRHAHTVPHLAFLRVLESGLRLSCLCNQDSYPLHHLPSPIAVPLSLLFLLSPKIETKTNKQTKLVLLLPFIYQGPLKSMLYTRCCGKFKTQRQSVRV